MPGIVKIDFRITGAEGVKAAIRSLSEEANRAASNEARVRASKLRETERLALEVARNQEKAAKQAAQAEVRAAKEAANEATRIKKDAARQVENAERDAARNKVRQERETAREQARVAREQERAIAASRESFRHSINRVSHGAVGNVKSMAGIAGKVTGLSNFDITGSNLMQGVIDRDTMARRLSNAAYMPGAQGAAGQRISATTIQSDAAKVAQETAMASKSVLEGMSKFVSLTGDFQSAKGLAKDMAVLSQATGSNFEDMMSSAAQVSQAMETAYGSDVQGRMEATVQIMRQFGGQGKIGAVEIKNLAKEMSKVGAASGVFAGDKKEIFGQLGAMVQLSMGAKGGSATATQAATAAMAFGRDLTKSANLKNYQAAGINVFADKTRTKLRSPEDIIQQILSKSNGDLGIMSKLVPNAMSMRAVRPFQQVYVEAEEKARKEKGKNFKQGEAGSAAVKAEFDKYRKISMGEGEIADSFKNIMDGPAAKAALFQNNMERIAEATASKLLPALEKVGPHLLKGAEKTSSIIQFAAENPIKAAGIALGAAILKAGIEEIIKSSIAKLLTRAVGSGAGGGRIGPPGAGVGAVGKALGVVGAAAGGYYAGTLIAEKIDQSINKEEKTARDKNLDTMNMTSLLNSGQASRADVEQARARLAELDKQQAEEKNSVRNKVSGAVTSVFGTGLISGAVDGLTGNTAAKGREKETAGVADDLRKALGNVKIADGSTVNIGNAADIVNGINKAIGSRDPTGQPIAGGT